TTERDHLSGYGPDVLAPRQEGLGWQRHPNGRILPPRKRTCLSATVWPCSISNRWQRSLAARMSGQRKSSWSGWIVPVLLLAAECSTRLTCWPRLWWPGGGWCDGSSEHEKSPRRMWGHPPGAA